jgi:hypothetical protein
MLRLFTLITLTFILDSILVLLPITSFSQRPETYPRSFGGAYLGPNLSGFIGDYKANVEGKTGGIRLRTQYGFFGKIYISKDWSAFTALQLVLNGSMTKNDNAKSATVTISYVAKTNLTTLSIPGMIIFTPRQDYGIILGPQFDLILSAKEPWNRSDVIKPPEYKDDVIEKFNQAGLSLAIGAYYLMLNGFSFHIRYTQAVMSVSKSEYGNTLPYSIQFYAGITLFKK